MKRNNKKQAAPPITIAQPRSDYGFVNLSTYTSPEIKEVANKDWVAYGEDNNYFQFLIDRYNGSPTNNAAVNGISQAIYGKGLGATDANRKPEQYAQMISLLHKDCVRKVSYDLKLMGQAAIQVIYSKDRKKIAQLEHFPIETLRAEKANDDGEIPAYYYFKDWTEIKPSDKPLRIPAYGKSKEKIEMYYIKPYRAGFYYYSPVDYQGGLQYCELEEEISNYHLNNIMNGLAPSMLINFNNGTPNQQERELIEQRIASKFSGSSNSGKFILAFNDNKESQAEITPVQLSDAHNQYQFLSDESAKKIMVAHRIVSPMLLGIKDSSGLGNNAEEIKTASLLMDNTVIRPFQELLIDCFDQLLAYNDISLNLYFITLQPLEFTEVDDDIQDREEIEEETGYKMSKQIDGKVAYETIKEAEVAAEQMGCKGHHEHEVEGETYYMPCESHEELKAPCWDGYEQIGMKMKNGKKVPNCVPLESEEKDLSSELSELLSLGKDEDELLNSYDLIDVSEVDYEKDDEFDTKITELNEPSLLSKITHLVKTGKPYPKKESEQDGTTKQDEKLKFLVRYQYAPLKMQGDSRKFCKAMVRAKKVYRKEDIVRMGKQQVNPGFGVGGAATYSIWLYKGGARCHHKWFRKTYMLTDGKKGKKEITTKAARSKGFRAPVNNLLVPVAPVDMKYEGYTKAYWDKMGFKKKK
tara:strand:+ start:2283 stop:4367 length:2085 start_codon:yes stop_codon:yes gene_type:complete